MLNDEAQRVSLTVRRPRDTIQSMSIRSGENFQSYKDAVSIFFFFCSLFLNVSYNRARTRSSYWKHGTNYYVKAARDVPAQL